MSTPLALFLASAAVLASASARAQSASDPPEARAPAAAHDDAHPVSFALLAGYAVNGATDTGQTGNMFGAGFGLRGGYTFPNGMYAGLTAVYHLGYDKELGQGATASSRLMPIGFEGGYDLRFGALTVRPFVGVGVALYKSSQDGPGPTFIQGSGSKFALWPGVLATYDATDRFFVGVDLRYTMVWTGAEAYDVAPDGGAPEAFGAFAEVGFRIWP